MCRHDDGRKGVEGQLLVSGRQDECEGPIRWKRGSGAWVEVWVGGWFGKDEK